MINLHQQTYKQIRKVLFQDFFCLLGGPVSYPLTEPQNPSLFKRYCPHRPRVSGMANGKSNQVFDNNK